MKSNQVYQRSKVVTPTTLHSQGQNKPVEDLITNNMETASKYSQVVSDIENCKPEITIYNSGLEDLKCLVKDFIDGKATINDLKKAIE